MVTGVVVMGGGGGRRAARPATAGWCRGVGNLDQLPDIISGIYSYIIEVYYIKHVYAMIYNG